MAMMEIRSRRLLAATATVGLLVLGAACSDDGADGPASVDSAAVVNTQATDGTASPSSGAVAGSAVTEGTDTPASATPATGQITVTVGTDDATALGGRTETVSKGSRVLLTVSAATSQEIHVHGYDLEAVAGPDAPARFDFTADKLGTFAVESHAGDRLLLELVVQ